MRNVLECENQQDEVGTSKFSLLVKRHRKLRKKSQFDLSLDAVISQKHLSFLETGRAKPSRDMVLILSDALDLTLRDRNLLLNAAGFSSFYKERSLDNKEMQSVLTVLEMSLKHHNPYPAIVVDGQWNLLMSNEATARFISLLGDPEDIWRTVDPSGKKNIYRLTFCSQGLRPFIGNWQQLEKHLLLRLQREVNDYPDNNELRFLLDDLINKSNSDVIAESEKDSLSLGPIIPMNIVLGDLRLKIYSMISSFGSALDVTAEELKVETFFPADDVTRSFFMQL